MESGNDFSGGGGGKKGDGWGFRGRIGIHEVLEINDTIREMIMKRANAAEIKAAAIRNGMVPMMEDGLEKVARGITTIEEILRVFHE